MTPQYFMLPQAGADITDDGLDNPFARKERILQAKLEVLVAEMAGRFRIRSENLDRIEDETTTVKSMIEALTRHANYHLREHREKADLYRQVFTLLAERREQDVECWRDIVLVMRDFLEAWEAHERARSKSSLFNHEA